jgi:non-canonical purine NTP pyrophosphatase (RdgB/HAM1 family)
LAKTLLIGSANPGKAKELAELLVGLPWKVEGLKAFPPIEAPEETGTTFEENAALKARYYSAAYDVACVADDSGLVVDALGGAPGVYSARYAGEDGNAGKNMAKLLEELSGTPSDERTARFTCCAAFLAPNGDMHLETGTVEGHISMQKSGAGGFGYDPVFVPLGHERSFAEMSSEEKHALSHRGQAFDKLRRYLEGRP